MSSEGTDGFSIEADLILFHPYDRWGFSGFSREEDMVYLDYCLRRLASFRNVWWSMANEYDMVFNKTVDDWEALGTYVSAEDPYSHLVSIHNWLSVYDASRPWITHCSVQTNVYERTKLIRDQYKKPVMIDECRYEGNIESQWGNISAFEMVHRFWSVMLLGGYCTHGETFHREDEVLWWAKGGDLYGESPERIAFLKGIMGELDGDIEPNQDRFAMDPNNMNTELDQNNPFAKVILGLNPLEREYLRFSTISYSGGDGHKFMIQYLGHECRCYYDMVLPEDGSQYAIDVIDIWEMTRERVNENASGKTRVSLPGKEGIAVIATRLDDNN